MNSHTLEGFRKSKTKLKKYDGLLKDNQGRIVAVPFGAMRKDGIPYQQYKDRTGLGLYSAFDHGDKDRRNRYHARHKKDAQPGMFSPGWFALHFLW